MYREGGGGATKKTRRNAGLWETRNEEWTGADG